MQPNNKRKPTLKELMAMQGKIKSSGIPAAAPAPRGLKERMAVTPETPPPKTKWQETRDGRIKTMLEQDPEQAAELLRNLFLRGKD